MSLIDTHGYYGEFGGAFVPELLYKNLEELENCYLQIMRSEEFKLVGKLTFLPSCNSSRYSETLNQLGATNLPSKTVIFPDFIIKN